MWIKAFLLGLSVCIVSPAVVFPIIPDNDKTIEPYAVLIFVEKSNNNNNFGRLGGGSIISEQHVVTAASVIHGADSILIGYDSNEVKQQKIKRTDIYQIHPKYNPETGENDIAVIFLTLRNKFDFRLRSVSKIKLPTVQPKIGTIGILGGYGYSDPYANKASEYLQIAELKVIGLQACRNEFKLSVNSQFCAMPMQGISNVCSGDHGAGLVAPEIIIPPIPATTLPPVDVTTAKVGSDGKIVPTESNNVLIGIASMISSTCNVNDPSAYTNVRQFVDWISTVTNVYP